MDAKGELIGEIEAIYRDLGHARRGKPLNDFTLEQLHRHLVSLNYGIEWVRRDKKVEVGRVGQNDSSSGAQKSVLEASVSLESGEPTPNCAIS